MIRNHFFLRVLRFFYINIWRRFVVYRQFLTLKRLSSPRFPLRLKNRQLCLEDVTSATTFDRHYVFHTAWAARILSESKPLEHSDFSSSIYFSALCSAFIPIHFFDLRPANITLSGLSSRTADLTNLFLPNDSLKSISCMHVVEHIGLGRYGDELDQDGDLKAIRELMRVCASGGQILFVVPVGKPRIMFNAHRIYSYAQVLEAFSGMHLKEFSLIPDAAEEGGLLRNADPQSVEQQNYGCGCFWFIKK